MALNDDELRYKNVIGMLKSLPQVKAPHNFEAELLRKINSEKYEEKKQSFWQKVFLPSRLIPSAGLAVAAVVLLFFVNLNSEEAENPLLMEPKVREDIIEAKDISDIPLGSEENQTRQPAEESIVPERGNERNEVNPQQRSTVHSYSSGEFAINKDGLNFRQINLSKEEKQRLNELKEHIKKLFYESQNN